VPAGVKPGPKAKRKSATAADSGTQIPSEVQSIPSDGTQIPSNGGDIPGGNIQTSGLDGRDSESGEIVWAHSIVELADSLKVSRQTIYNWQQLPGCPSARSSGNYFVAEWRSFQEDLGTTEEGQPQKKKDLEERLLKTKCEQAEWKLERDRGEWTQNVVIADEINRLVNELVTQLKDCLEERIPKTGAKKLEAELRKLCVAELDRLMVRIQSGPAEVVANLTAAGRETPRED
jgi:hypothetical protein